jgi:PAS domain-containing protein
VKKSKMSNNNNQIDENFFDTLGVTWDGNDFDPNHGFNVPQSPANVTQHLTNFPEEFLANFESGAIPEDTFATNATQIGKRVNRVDREQNLHQADVTPEQLNKWVDGLMLSDQADLGQHGHGVTGLGSQSPNTRPRKKAAGVFGEEEDEITEATGKVPSTVNIQTIDPALLDPEYDSPLYMPNSSPAVNVPSSSPNPNQWHGHLSRSGEFNRQPQSQPPNRRRSVSARPTAVPSYHPFTMQQHHHDVPQLDAYYVKVHLMEMGYPNVKKEPKAFCNQVVQFICQYAKIFVGGFYLNNNSPSMQNASWILSCSYPSTTDFNQYFHYNVGERFIVQAAMEKRCFCVHSSSWENNSGLLSFLFVPIPNELVPTGNALAVMVLGTILKGEVDLHAHLLFLDQVRKPIAGILRTLLSLQHNLNVLQRVDTSALDHEINKQGNVAERTILAVENLRLNGDELAIIATNLQGLITFMSNAAQHMLGYSSDELVGKVNLTHLHDLMELTERAKELEREFHKHFRVEFPVLTYRTITSRGQDDTRTWRWVKKDRSIINVTMTIRPLHDDLSQVFGFVAIASQGSVSPPSRVASSPTSQHKYNSPLQDHEAKSE